jgi:hypothetical protein
LVQVVSLLPVLSYLLWWLQFYGWGRKRVRNWTLDVTYHFRRVTDWAPVGDALSGYILKLSVKSGKDGTGTPCLFTHIGDEISKNSEKKTYIGLQGEHETQFSSKFDAKLSLPCPFFSWTLWTNHCCCYVY